MAIFRKKKRRERDAKLVEIGYYAPETDLTPVDYVFPIYSEYRLMEAEKRIKQFLDHTNPDRYSGFFYDAFVEKEEALLISQLRQQKPNHEGVASRITLKHESELARLESAIQQKEKELEKIDALINKWQALYDQHNG